MISRAVSFLLFLSISFSTIIIVNPGDDPAHANSQAKTGDILHFTAGDHVDRKVLLHTFSHLSGFSKLSHSQNWHFL